MNIKPVFLVVDMQNGFCGVGGSFDKLGLSVEPYRRIIPNLTKMISYMRGISIPIYYTKVIKESAGLDLIDRRVLNVLPENQGEKIDDMQLCVKDTWDADIIEEIHPLPGDLILEKSRNSVFQDTEFENWLRTSGADTIIFSGNDSYTCVESSARDAFNKGYNVIMLSDCVASKEENLHIANLLEIAEAYGLVLTSNEMIEKLNNKSLLSGIEPPTVSMISS